MALILRGYIEKSERHWIYRMKILLLFPPITVNKKSVKKCDLPLGLAYIAAYLEKEGHDVRVLDICLEGYENERSHGEEITFGLNDRDIKERIESISPELIGISCPYSIQFHNMVQVSRLVKEVGDIPVLVGGIHPAFDPEGILKTVDTVDYVAIGEGELITADLADRRPLDEIDGLAYRKSGSTVINKPRELIENIDSLPFPARHLFNMEKYIRINKPHNHFPKKDRVASIITSRGCYGKCTFCASAAFWRNKLRVRPVDSVIKEMKILVDEYDIQEIQILDDNMTGIKKRAKELFQIMGELGIVWSAPNGVRIDTIDREMLELMKKSGCYRITYAIESGDQDTLDRLIKKPLRLERIEPIIKMTKRAGIGVHTYWIIGFPGETREQIWKTYNYAKSLRTESSSISLAMPLIGTELLEMCRRQGLLRDDFDQTVTSCRHAEIKNERISREELEKLCDYFNDTINRGLLWRDPAAFFRKYYKEMLRNPGGMSNMFKKFT